MIYLLGIALMGKLQAKSMVQTEVLDEFLFADGMAKGAPTEETFHCDGRLLCKAFQVPANIPPQSFLC